MSARPVSLGPDLAAPVYSGFTNPVSRLRRGLGVFSNVRLPDKDAARHRDAAKLIAVPKPQAREQALGRNGGTARLENERSGTVLRGMVESWASESRETAERTAVFGAERDLVVERRRLRLQSELGLHDEDAADAGASDDSLENLGYALQLAGEEPSGGISYGVAFDYMGAGFRPEVETGDELRLRFNGGWQLDGATRLSGYAGRAARDIGTENPQEGWTAGTTLNRALLPESMPGLSANLGLEGSRLADAENSADLLVARIRLGLGAPLSERLHGRMAVITEEERDRIGGAARHATELRFGLERNFRLACASAQFAGEASLRDRSGSDVAGEAGTAGVSFTVSDGNDSLSLRGRLVGRRDHMVSENRALGGELSSRVMHLGGYYSAGIEASVQDVPADREAGTYRTGLFVTLPF